MARTLPWLSEKPLQSKRSAGSSSIERAPKRKRVEPETDDAPTIHVASRNDSPHVRRRSPSTSPPPAPPPQELMRSSDNAWIMVEDELYAVAQQFTQHLHHAEYKRLQREAAERNRQTTLPRPIDKRAHLSLERQILKKAERHRAKLADSGTGSKPVQKKRGGTSDGELEDDSEIDMAISDRHLAGLMQGTGSGGVPDRVILDGGQRSSTSRAAAGFLKQTSSTRARTSSKAYDIPGAAIQTDKGPRGHQLLVENGDSTASEDDDLDEPSLKREPKSLIKATTMIQREKPVNDNTAKLSRDIPLGQPHIGLSVVAPSRRPDVTQLRSTPIPPLPAHSSSLEDDFLIPRAPAPRLSRRPKAPRPSGSEKNKPAVVKLEEIPTFLF